MFMKSYVQLSRESKRLSYHGSQGWKGGSKQYAIK